MHRHGHGFRYGRHHGPPMHVRLFWWFGLSILVMGSVVMAVVWTAGPASHRWEDERRRVNTFVEGRFRTVWRDEGARTELASAVARDLDLGVVLRDDRGQRLFTAGPECSSPIVVPVKDGSVPLGDVTVCFKRPNFEGRHTFLLALAGAGFTLWTMSLFFAKRLGRPLRELARVAGEIGDGRLSARASIGRRPVGEVRMLASAINDMADRIEKQISDQRELVAAVSHEIRAPLSRLRVLVEMLRDRGVDATTLSKIDREVVEIDSLVGDLLASARLDFSLMAWKELDATELAVEALDRAGVPPDRLDVVTSNVAFEGDATLVARALANLLGNADRHGGGVETLSVRDAGAGSLSFEVTDRGPGFSADVLPRAFEAFQKGQVERRGGASLGLGLALVRRIAEAHGGTATAENRPEGGSRVVFAVARRRRDTSS
jgi:signal transduction histidine kinase